MYHVFCSLWPVGRGPIYPLTPYMDPRPTRGGPGGTTRREETDGRTCCIRPARSSLTSVLCCTEYVVCTCLGGWRRPGEWKEIPGPRNISFVDLVSSPARAIRTRVLRPANHRNDKTKVHQSRARWRGELVPRSIDRQTDGTRAERQRKEELANQRGWRQFPGSTAKIECRPETRQRLSVLARGTEAVEGTGGDLLGWGLERGLGWGMCSRTQVE